MRDIKENHQTVEEISIIKDNAYLNKSVINKSQQHTIFVECEEVVKPKAPLEETALRNES